MQQEIKYGSRVINFNLQRRDRKTLGIKVYPDGKVEVLSPSTAEKKDIEKKIRQKAAWILKQIDYFESYKPATPERMYISGETHLYLGRQYKLKIVPDVENAVKAYHGQLWLYAVDTRPRAIKRQLNSWYKQKALIVFNELLHAVLPKFNRYKITIPTLSLRTMSKRWGSCTAAGKIILNTELIKAPKICIEYIIIHEICHLIHANHKKDFYLLLSSIMPDYQKVKQKLEITLS